MTFYDREYLFRGKEEFDKILDKPIFICGIGAIGSNLAVCLARMGFTNLFFIDDDIVELENISTQVYSTPDVGKPKAKALARILSNINYGEYVGFNKHLTASSCRDYYAKILSLTGVPLMIDSFDNVESRRSTTHFPCNVMHVGLGYGISEGKWNDNYVIPDEDPEGDMCVLGMTRTIILVTVQLAIESIILYLSKKEKWNFEFKTPEHLLESRIKFYQ